MNCALPEVSVATMEKVVQLYLTRRSTIARASSRSDAEIERKLLSCSMTVLSAMSMLSESQRKVGVTTISDKVFNMYHLAALAVCEYCKYVMYIMVGTTVDLLFTESRNVSQTNFRNASGKYDLHEGTVNS
jgi:hypothetical protein